MTIRTEPINEDCVLVVTLDGRFDASHTDAANETLKRVIDANVSTVIVDLTQVPFIDSAELSTLVSSLKRARSTGGNVLLLGVQPQTRTVFKLTMRDQVFTIHPTVQSAPDDRV
ncbi:MAG: STAS domain-containing protein [Ardenticatenia bacterium]|nr:STAS domain-containing protein [Ardenticatenia bacterium]